MTAAHWLSLGFWAFAAITIVPAVCILLSKNIIHAAFWLLASLFGFAGLYMIIGADFLAFTQVLVYIGGILVLILFGVMLTQKDPFSVARTPLVGNTAYGIAVFFLVLVGALYMVSQTGWVGVEAPPAPGPALAPVPTTALIGDQLMTKYILPFEIVSVLLLAALVGAVYVARGREEAE